MTVVFLVQEGTLLDMYARSDITALAKANSYSRLQWEEVTVGQALALAQYPSQSSPQVQLPPIPNLHQKQALDVSHKAL